uniref:Uncharacterized protein n=1 Tax=Steinernema glaseri TaxID=37863 RepID=A0A1I7ZUL2_9BILA
MLTHLPTVDLICQTIDRVLACGFHSDLNVTPPSCQVLDDRSMFSALSLALRREHINLFDGYFYACFTSFLSD